jgi:hypothetical protein
MPGRRTRSGLGRRTLNLEIGLPTYLQTLIPQLPNSRHSSFFAANTYEEMTMWVDKMVIFIIIKDISMLKENYVFHPKYHKSATPEKSSLNAMFFQQLPAHHYAVFSTISHYFFSDGFGHTPLH